LIWDPIRQQNLVLTPEEHVRQCLIRFLREERGFPRALFSIEKGLTYSERKKRYDLLVYDREAQPLLAMECKAPDIPLDEKAARQLAVYNSKIGAPFLLLTNGMLYLFFSKNSNNRWVPEPDVPEYEELLLRIKNDS